MLKPAALAAALSLIAGAAVAQTAAPAPPNGATVADIRAWLTAAGGQVSEPETAGEAQVIRIADRLPWTLSFYNCQNLCDDLQYSAVFTGQIDEARVDAWNRDMRYLKAVWLAPETPGAEAAVVVQYDVLLTETGAEQLREPTHAWLELLRAFTAYLQQGAAPAPAAE